jgi:hypothetical protein
MIMPVARRAGALARQQVSADALSERVERIERRLELGAWVFTGAPRAP